MKSVILTIAAILALTSLSFAQDNPIDFEQGGYGADWTWNVFENDTNPPLEVIVNPDPSGINTSSTVAKFTALATGQAYAGTESAHGGTNLGTFTLDQTNSTIKIMVWKTVISDVGIKLVSDSSWSEPEIKVANTKVNEWEELTFDFSGHINPPADQGELDQIVIFPDFQERSEDHVVYFDNITFSEAMTTNQQPTAAAPTPTQDPDSVISMFSSAYNDVPVDTWKTDWSSATFEDSVMIDGTPVKKYSALDFVGIETVQNQIDASDMDYFHIDVWSPNFTQFSVKLVDFGADGAFGGGDDSEHQINYSSPAQGQWVSYDIPLSDFTGLASRKNLAQYILVGQPSGAAIVYVDNMYFYAQSGSNLPDMPQTPAPAPSQDQANVISLFSSAYNDVPVDTWRTDWSAADFTDSVMVDGTPVKKYSNLDFVGIETTAPNQIDATDMTHVHIDVWSADYTRFSLKLVDFGADGAYQGGDDSEHQVDFDTPEQGQWVSYDIPLSDFTNLAARAHLSQYILVGQPTGNTTIFVDNFYFYKETGTAIEDTKDQPRRFSLSQNYPNPFNPTTNINFSIPQQGKVKVEVFNVQGQRVATLVNEVRSAGAHTITFDASHLSSGIYTYRIISGDFVQVKKMTLIK